MRKTIHGHGDDKDFVPMSGRIIREMVGRRTWPTMRRALDGLLETRPHIGGVRCRGYRLGERLTGPLHRVHLLDPRIVKRLEALRAQFLQIQEEVQLPIHRRLRERQSELTIDPGVYAALAELSDRARPPQEALIDSIQQRQIRFSVSATGRVFHWVTGLARSLRPFILLAGEPICGVDIVGAQPALLGLLFHPNGLKGAPSLYPYPSPLIRLASLVPLLWLGASASVSRPVAARIVGFFDSLPGLLRCVGPDASVFADLAASGCLYEMLLELCVAAGVQMPADVECRSWIKRRFLIDILVCAGEYPCDLAFLFRERFPSVFRFLALANRDNRGTVIGSLQALESALVVLSVAPRLVERIPIVTLHDALICRRRDRPLVRDAFYETFDDLGFHFQLKEE